MKNDRFILNRNSDTKVIYIGTGQFRLDSGKWVDAILYKYKGVYKMMEASEFIGLAESDRSTTLNKQKTVTEMVQDQLGPGYVARGREGGKPIMVKEVECEDAGRDLVVADDDDDDPNISKPWSDNRQRVSIEPDLTIH